MRLNRHVRGLIAGVVMLSIGITNVGAGAANASTESSIRGGSGGGKFDLSLALAGQYGPPSEAYENPCNPGEKFVAKRLALDVADRARVKDFNGIPHQRWIRFCEEADGFPRDDSILEFWYALPTPEVIAQGLIANFPAYLDPPEVEWPSEDPEFNWLYVNAPMDFRVSNLAPVTLFASIRNEAGTATATATATPTSLTLDPGEPGGSGTQCAFADAQAGYSDAVPGACSYKYRNSSAISANGRTFDVTVTVDWPIVSDPPQTPPSLQTFSTSPVAVAEVQSLVTCIGSQGEC